MKKFIPLFDQMFAISKVTFHELIREKILWSTLVFSVMILGLSLAVGQLSFYEPWRITLDFGAAGVGLTGGLIGIIVGGSLISKEIRDRTLYIILTKSVWRWQFVLGKLMGLFGVLVLNSVLMYTVMFFIYKVSGGKFHINYLWNLHLQLMEFFILATIGVFFSTFTTSMLASIFCGGIWLIGHVMDDVQIALSKISVDLLRESSLWLIKILPDLTVFNIKSQLSHSIPVPVLGITSATLYALVYCAFVINAAFFIFSKRDL